jgi:cytochrome c biogenesis protein CcmG/thiol:disulfide interchange protein DsbE
VSVESGPAKTRRNWLAILPLVVFVGLAAIFLIQLRSGEDSSFVPSVLIGREAPAMTIAEMP